MKKKLLFVYNPNAGKGLLKTCLSDVIDLFTKDNFFVTAYPTQKKRDALKVIEKFKALEKAKRDWKKQ